MNNLFIRVMYEYSNTLFIHTVYIENNKFRQLTYHHNSAIKHEPFTSAAGYCQIQSFRQQTDTICE